MRFWKWETSLFFTVLLLKHNECTISPHQRRYYTMLIICAKVSSGYSYSMGYIWLHEYSKLPNKHAARLSIFQCFSYHHALIWQHIFSTYIKISARLESAKSIISLQFCPIYNLQICTNIRSADINQKSADLIWCKLGACKQDKTAD